MKRLEQLQPLRALAATLIVILDIGLVVAHYGKGLPPVTAVRHLALFGNCGIDIFFVLSGFVVFYSQDRNLADRSAAQAFLVRRAIRIYPLFFLASAIILAVHSVGIAHHQHVYSFDYILASVSLFPLPREDGEIIGSPFLAQAWTLSFEIYFYALFALVIAFGTNTWRLATLAILVAFFATLGHALPKTTGLAALLTSRLPIEFLLGSAAAWLVLRHRPTMRPFRIALIAFGATALLASLFIGDISTSGNMAWAAGSFALVLGIALQRLPKNKVWRQIVFVGDASYSIYLTHPVITVLLASTLRQGHLNWLSADCTIVFFSGLSLATGILVYIHIERPIREALTARAAKKRAEAAESAPQTAGF